MRVVSPFLLSENFQWLHVYQLASMISIHFNVYLMNWGICSHILRPAFSYSSIHNLDTPYKGVNEQCSTRSFSYYGSFGKYQSSSPLSSTAVFSLLLFWGLILPRETNAYGLLFCVCLLLFYSEWQLDSRLSKPCHEDPSWLFSEFMLQLRFCFCCYFSLCNIKRPSCETSTSAWL